MKVLVTGGAGFVGSHVVEVLREQGHFVTIWDRKIGSEIIEQTSVEADAVIHCAAKADISENWSRFSERNELWADNYEVTWKLLELCIASESVKTFVFVSTGAVYMGGHGWTEADRVLATSPYAASKLTGEAMTEAYALKAGWRYSIARLVSCVGARYRHGHIVDFVRMAKEGKIHAKDRGNAAKDFIHVRDAAEVLVCMAEGNLFSGIYNVAAGQPWSWRDTVKLMDVDFEYEDREAGWVGDPVGLQLDITKLSHFYKKPARLVSDGVREALEGLGWHR